MPALATSAPGAPVSASERWPVQGFSAGFGLERCKPLVFLRFGLEGFSLVG